MADPTLRILVLANLPPYVLGGAENQTARLISGWLADGAYIEVAGHSMPGRLVEIAGRRLASHSLRPFGRGRAGRGLGLAMRLSALLLSKRREFDVVYSRSLGEGVLVLCMLRRLGLFRVPVVVCPINAAGRGDVNFVRGLPFHRWLFRLVDAQVGAINLINADIGGELDAMGVVRPLRAAIPNGIALREPVARACVGSPRHLVWTGRLEPQKRIDLLLQALATRRNKGDRFVVTLVGDGSMRNDLRLQCAALGLDDVVRFLPGIEPAAVRSLLTDADVFMLPSSYEGMSNSAIEAMEAGLPVLCTRCGGIDRYVLDDAGWVCEPDSLEGLEAALGRMFNATDDALMEKGRQARKTTERMFDIVDVARRNLSLLASVARTS